MRYGYKASAEQFAPRELIDHSRLAAELGLDTIAISDHFQPWRHNGGHTPAVLPWLGAIGERTQSGMLGTSVLTPTMRYYPSIVAQNFATLACMNPGRVFLGVGPGEALNETPATKAAWPSTKERRMMLGEAIELIRTLWTQERVSFEGEYYQTDRATIYDKPDRPIPIYVAASGPLAAKLAGRVGDGSIATSGGSGGSGAARRRRCPGALELSTASSSARVSSPVRSRADGSPTQAAGGRPRG